MDTGFQNWGENQPSHIEYALHYFVLVVLTSDYWLSISNCQISTAYIIMHLIY